MKKNNPKSILESLEKLCPRELFEGSKDWRESDLIGRVELLISCYKSQREEIDLWLTEIERLNNVIDSKD